MTEPGARLQPLKKLERPKPHTIQPAEETEFPQASVEQLGARTETERTQQEWKATKDFVLLQAEANRIMDGLNTIAAMESGQGINAEKIKSPNFKEAQKTVAEWQTVFPQKEIAELVADIQRRIQNNLGREVANLTAAGIEVPSGVKFDAIQDFVTTAPTARLLLTGLRQSMTENPIASPERARAQRFLANENLRTPQEGIKRIEEIMQGKIDVLNRLGIQIP